MALRVSTIFGFLALLLPLVTASHWGRRHQLAHRVRGDVDIHKRQSFTNARFTFYAVGLGACGVVNNPGDFIVALNVDQFQSYGSGYPSPVCFNSITITYNGKTAGATIMDECMGCPWGGLDFSTGLFDFFTDNDEGLGVIYGEWWFNNGATTSSQWTPPTTTTTWEQPTPTSTPDYTPPATTSSTIAYTPPTTSTTSTSTTTSTTSTSTHASSISSVSGLAAPTGGVVPVANSSNPQNILVINTIVIKLGLLVSAELNQ